MSPKKTQVLLIGGGLLLCVLLFIAPRIKPSTPEEEGGSAAPAAAMAQTATLDVYLGQAQKSLEPGLKEQLSQLKVNDSIAAFWDRQKRPDLASFYAEEQARADNTAAAWFKAGNRYYYAVQFSKDQSEIPALYQSATRCLNKGLALEPNNTDARIMLASCYVEGSGDPMEGIRRLREIEKTDSSNVKLQLAFAFFSVKSGQVDRAITRFNKVLAIDSTYVVAYLYLADAYGQLNDTENTIKALEGYVAHTPDATTRSEINKEIQRLKNK